MYLLAKTTTVEVRPTGIRSPLSLVLEVGRTTKECVGDASFFIGDENVRLINYHLAFFARILCFGDSRLSRSEFTKKKY